MSATGVEAPDCAAHRAGGLDFELPYLSKFLLLAAYVACRNPPAQDRKLFDAQAAGKRRRGVLSHDQQVCVPGTMHMVKYGNSVVVAAVGWK